ncbi:MAG: hypothetical protein ABW252_16865 [Polyangiales bacterium]
MIRTNLLLKLALATTLFSSTALAAAGDTTSLKVYDEEDTDSGRAGEIYAELSMSNSASVGKATLKLWNRSGTPQVAYKVTVRVICSGQGAAQNFTGTLSSGGSSNTLTTRCKSGSVGEATAFITRV